jgi:hypothetical protein
MTRATSKSKSQRHDPAQTISRIVSTAGQTCHGRQEYKCPHASSYTHKEPYPSPPHAPIRFRESPPRHRPAGCRRLVEYRPDLSPTRRDKPGQEWTCSRFCSHLTSSSTARKDSFPDKL